MQFFALLLFALVIIWGESASQQLPSAEEVLNRYAKVLGGREAILEHSSMTVIGRLELPNKKGVLDQIHYYKNGKRLEKISFPDGRVSLSGFDGKIGWEVSSAGETSLHLGDEARTWARDADMHYPAHVLDYFRSMQVLEITKFQDHTCYRLRGVTNWGRVNEHFYDKDTGLLVGYRFSSEWRGGPGDTVILFLDYRPFDGWLMPARSTYTDAEGTETDTIISVTFDNVDDGVFALTPAVKQRLQEASGNQDPPKPTQTLQPIIETR